MAGIQNVNAYLSVADAVAAVDFYAKVFEAKEVGPRLTGPDGKIAHTELRIGNATLMLSAENPGFGNVSPKTLGGTPVRLNVEVDNADAVAEKAVAAGGEILIAVADQFYGYRSGRFRDPFGHEWILSQKLEDVTHEEMQKRMDAMSQSG